MAFICETCGADFPQTPKGKQEWLLHRAEHNNADPGLGVPGETATGKEIERSLSAKEIREQQEEEKKNRKAEPIDLEYRWTGECPTCFNKIDSLTLEAGQEKGKVVTVAFCSTCRKQVRERVVEKL